MDPHRLNIPGFSLTINILLTNDYHRNIQYIPRLHPSITLIASHSVSIIASVSLSKTKCSFSIPINLCVIMISDSNKFKIS